MSDAWGLLRSELDALAAAGQTATLWWRDDDAAVLTPALQELVSLAEAHEVPLMLAVIPKTLEPDMANYVVRYREVTVWQHGWAHQNHAPASEKKMELGAHRPRALVIDELQAGYERLTEAFPGRFHPMLVPPWNRIDPGLFAALPSVGLTGVSTFTPRRLPEAAPRLRQVNCHVDIIDWNRRAFRGTDSCLVTLCDLPSAS